MKTTIDIADDLFLRAKEVAKETDTTLKRLVEAGLREVLARREAPVRVQIEPVTVKGCGLQREFRGASWGKVRDAIYANGVGEGDGDRAE